MPDVQALIVLTQYVNLKLNVYDSKRKSLDRLIPVRSSYRLKFGTWRCMVEPWGW
jgi:hypothetical protein